MDPLAYQQQLRDLWKDAAIKAIQIKMSKATGWATSHDPRAVFYPAIRIADEITEAFVAREETLFLK